MTLASIVIVSSVKQVHNLCTLVNELWIGLVNTDSHTWPSQNSSFRNFSRSHGKSSKSSGVAEGRFLITEPSPSVTSSQSLQRNLKHWPVCKSLTYGCKRMYNCKCSGQMLALVRWKEPTFYKCICIIFRKQILGFWETALKVYIFYEFWLDSKYIIGTNSLI